jgi:hypothetical protein
MGADWADGPIYKLDDSYPDFLSISLKFNTVGEIWLNARGQLHILLLYIVSKGGKKRSKDRRIHKH